MSKTVTIPEDRNPYVVEINGRVYTYKAGETVTVPDDVAEAILNAGELAPVEDPPETVDQKIAEAMEQAVTQAVAQAVAACALYRHKITATLSNDNEEVFTVPAVAEVISSSSTAFTTAAQVYAAAPGTVFIATGTVNGTDINANAATIFIGSTFVLKKPGEDVVACGHALTTDLEYGYSASSVDLPTITITDTVVEA